MSSENGGSSFDVVQTSSGGKVVITGSGMQMSSGMQTTPSGTATKMGGSTTTMSGTSTMTSAGSTGTSSSTQTSSVSASGSKGGAPRVQATGAVVVVGALAAGVVGVVGML